MSDVATIRNFLQELATPVKANGFCHKVFVQSQAPRNFPEVRSRSVVVMASLDISNPLEHFMAIFHEIVGLRKVKREIFNVSVHPTSYQVCLVRQVISAWASMSISCAKFLPAAQITLPM